MAEPGEQEIRDAIRARMERCAPGASACPSEVARALRGTGWRELMDPVRAVARELVRDGELEIVRGGEVVDPDQVRGPIRLRPARRR